MPLPLSTLLMVLAICVWFSPAHVGTASVITASVLFAVAIANEGLRALFGVSRNLKNDPGYYTIEAAPQQPVAHRDTPE